MVDNFSESAVDDNDKYGYEVSRRQFQSSRYERWKFVQIVGQRYSLYT